MLCFIVAVSDIDHL